MTYASSDRNDKETKRLYRKYRRLPNGFGQISKIKGNLRNPYRAMVTVGKTPEGKPICKLLRPKAYFKTYNDAYKALLEYHENPFDLCENITCNELYKQWSEQHYKTIGRSYKVYERAWRYCHTLHDMPVTEVRPKHIKQCILDGTVHDNRGVTCVPASTQSKIKSLWNLMLDFALEREYISHNYARDVIMPKEVTARQKANYKGHKCLSENELEHLIANIDDIYAEMAYVQCYMGWRPDELCNLKTANVDLENMIITGGSKTTAGRDRIVPIHPAIQKIVARRYDPEHEYLYAPKYDVYRKNFVKMLPKHTPHDCRKTFVTKAKDAGLDEYAIKRLVGHVITDITENIYTERNIEWLRSEIEKL